MTGPRAAAVLLLGVLCGVAEGGDLLVYDRVTGGNRDLYLVPAEGGPERRLTDHPGEDRQPRFGPGGRTIVFSSNRTGNWQLLEMDAAGGAARRLRTNTAREWQADVSRDGRRLAFLSDLGGAEWLWLADRATGAARAIVQHGARAVLGNPHFSPDGRRLAFSSNWRVGHQIYLWEEGTPDLRRISPLLRGGCEPRFSPDGRKVTYVSRRHLRTRSELVEHELESGRERVLVSWDALNYDPVYSPDGREIAFVSNITGEYAIYRLRISDGRSWRVTFGPGAARSPDYAPR